MSHVEGHILSAAELKELLQLLADRMNEKARDGKEREEHVAARAVEISGLVPEGAEIAAGELELIFYDFDDAKLLFANTNTNILAGLEKRGVTFSTEARRAIEAYVLENLLRTEMIVEHKQRTLGDMALMPDIRLPGDAAVISAVSLVVKNAISDQELAVQANPLYQAIEQRMILIAEGSEAAGLLSREALEAILDWSPGDTPVEQEATQLIEYYRENPADLTRIFTLVSGLNIREDVAKIAQAPETQGLFPTTPTAERTRLAAEKAAQKAGILKNFGEGGKINTGLDFLIASQGPAIGDDEKRLQQAQDKARSNLVDHLNVLRHGLERSGIDGLALQLEIHGRAWKYIEEGDLQRDVAEIVGLQNRQSYGTLKGAKAGLDKLALDYNFDPAKWTADRQNIVKRVIIDVGTRDGDISALGPGLAQAAPGFANEKLNIEFAEAKPGDTDLADRLGQIGFFDPRNQAFSSQFLDIIAPRLEPILQSFAGQNSLAFDINRSLSDIFSTRGPVDREFALRQQQAEARLWAPPEVPEFELPERRPGAFFEEDPILRATEILRERSIPDRWGLLAPGESLALIDPFMFERQFGPAPPSPVQDPDPVVREAFQQGFAQSGLTDFPSFEDAISSRTAEILYGPELRFPDPSGVGNIETLGLINSLAGDSPGFFNFLADRLPQLVPQFQDYARSQLAESRQEAFERTATAFTQGEITGDRPSAAITRAQIPAFEAASLAPGAREFDFASFVQQQAPALQQEFAQTPQGRNEIEQHRLYQERLDIESRITDPEVLSVARLAAGESVPQLRFFQQQLPALAQQFGALGEPEPSPDFTFQYNAYPQLGSVGGMVSMSASAAPAEIERLRATGFGADRQMAGRLEGGFQEAQQAQVAALAQFAPPESFSEFFAQSFPSLQQSFALTTEGLQEENRKLAQFEQERLQARTLSLLQDPQALSVLAGAAGESVAQLQALAREFPGFAEEFAQTERTLTEFPSFISQKIPSAQQRFSLSAAGLREQQLQTEFAQQQRIAEVATGLPALEAIGAAAGGGIPFLTELTRQLPSFATQFVEAGEPGTFAEFFAPQVTELQQRFGLSPAGIREQEAMEREEQQRVEISALDDPAVRALLVERAEESVPRLTAFQRELPAFAREFAEAEPRPGTFAEFIRPRFGEIEQRFVTSPAGLREVEQEQFEEEGRREKLLRGGATRFVRAAV